jgi:hypothetical protein
MSPFKLHQSMVIALVRKFNEDGYTLKGASYFRDIELPPQLGRYSPDVLAVSPEGTYHIGEAKLEENLNTKKTYDQFTDFLNTKSPSNEPSQLHIIVLSEAEDKLKSLLTEWQMINNPNIHIWTY